MTENLYTKSKRLGWKMSRRNELNKEKIWNKFFGNIAPGYTHNIHLNLLKQYAKNINTFRADLFEHFFSLRISVTLSKINWIKFSHMQKNINKFYTF